MGAIWWWTLCCVGKGLLLTLRSKPERSALLINLCLAETHSVTICTSTLQTYVSFMYPLTQMGCKAYRRGFSNETLFKCMWNKKCIFISKFQYKWRTLYAKHHCHLQRPLPWGPLLHKFHQKQLQWEVIASHQTSVTFLYTLVVV